MPSVVQMPWNKNSGDIRIMNVDKNSSNHADMVFALDNGGAGPVERMRITGSGDIGINITESFLETLEVYDGASNVNTVLRIGTGAVSSTANGYAQIEFKHGTSNSCWIWHNANSTTGQGGANSLNFYNSNAADFTFSSGGGNEKVRIRDGGGITFNGDTAAANALDDYEEGTWTPTANERRHRFTIHYAS